MTPGYVSSLADKELLRLILDPFEVRLVYTAKTVVNRGLHAPTRSHVVSVMPNILPANICNEYSSQSPQYIWSTRHFTG